jgi:hypothetical protein
MRLADSKKNVTEQTAHTPIHSKVLFNLFREKSY